MATRQDVGGFLMRFVDMMEREEEENGGELVVTDMVVIASFEHEYDSGEGARGIMMRNLPAEHHHIEGLLHKALRAVEERP